MAFLFIKHIYVEVKVRGKECKYYARSPLCIQMELIQYILHLSDLMKTVNFTAQLLHSMLQTPLCSCSYWGHIFPFFQLSNILI